MVCVRAPKGFENPTGTSQAGSRLRRAALDLPVASWLEAAMGDG